MKDLALTNTNKKIFAWVMLIVVTFCLMIPTQAFAADPASTGADGVTVTMGEDGGIEIDSAGEVNFDSGKKGAWDEIFKRYKSIIVAFSGIATLTMMAAFVFLFMKLGATSGNEKERRSTITGILFTGIACAMLGSVTIIMSFFYNSFGSM